VNHKYTLAAVWIALSLVLGACGNEEETAKRDAAQKQIASDQAEVQKYNAYVQAANNRFDIGAALQEHLDYVPKALASGEKLTAYSVSSDASIISLQQDLKAALAFAHPMPELDEPAKALTDKLEKLKPINHDLAVYSESQGFYADNGDKARALEPAYEAAMTEAADAQGKFYDGIAARDEINTQKAFEHATKDSVDYYRAGIVLYSKQTMRLSRDFFETAGAEQATLAFEKSVNQSAQMIAAWDKKIREAHADGCPSMMMALNDFVGRARRAIEDARKGEFQPAGLTGRVFVTSPIERRAKDVQQGFTNLIETLNRHQCD